MEALLTSLHASPARYPLEPAGSSAAPPSARPPTPATSSDRVTTAERLTGFFVSLAAPLDRQPDLARVLIPRSHLPGPVASARTKRREGAIDRIEALLPESLSERRHRAAFLMDAFLGLQLAWSKRQGPADEGLADRVRRDLRWAVAGVLCDLNDSGVATRSTERDVSDGDARDDRRLGRSTTEPND